MEIKILHYYARNITFYKHSKCTYKEILHQRLNNARDKRNTVLPLNFRSWRVDILAVVAVSFPSSRKENIYDFLDVRGPHKIIWSLYENNTCLKVLLSVTCYILLGGCKDTGSNFLRNIGTCKPIYVSPHPKISKHGLYTLYKGLTWGSFGPCPVLAMDRAISSSSPCIRELAPRDLSPSLPAVQDKYFRFLITSSLALRNLHF